MKTYCFSEVIDAEWRGGRIRAQLSIFPRPGGTSAEWAEQPRLSVTRRDHAMLPKVPSETGELTTHQNVQDCCGIRAEGGKIEASIDLLDEDGQSPLMFSVRPNSGGNSMFERIYDEPWSRVANLNIQLRLTFFPPRKPEPVEYSFWNKFLSGGRPESNRRKF